MPNQFFSPEGDLERHFVTESWLIDQYLNTELWSWGNNNNAQLGDNTTLNKSTPVTTFAGGTDWKQISCGRDQTAAIKTDGTLWVWGSNSYGQLGINLGVGENRSTPVTTFAGGNNWKQVSSGQISILAIKTDGTLWGWGHNGQAQLGDNTIINRSTPVTTFAGGTNWKEVSCKYVHTAAVKTDGTLWTWGKNSYGQLGINNMITRSTPVTTFIGGTNWKQVSCGNAHTAAVKTDGTLWTWGRNQYGQLGNNTTVDELNPVTTFIGGTNWKQVSCGNAHTAAVKTDGTLWTWGKNSYGQLGINNMITRSTPVTTFIGGTNWKEIDINYHSSAIKTDGTLWVWGRNSYAQLGDGTTSNKLTPVTTFIGGNNWRSISSAASGSSALKFQYEGR